MQPSLFMLWSLPETVNIDERFENVWNEITCEHAEICSALHGHLHTTRQNLEEHARHHRRLRRKEIGWAVPPRIQKPPSHEQCRPNNLAESVTHISLVCLKSVYWVHLSGQLL